MDAVTHVNQVNQSKNLRLIACPCHWRVAMHLGVLLAFIFFVQILPQVLVTPAQAVSDTTPYATPDPPILQGRGTAMVDPVFGSTVIQLSDPSDSAYFVGHSYS